MLILIIILIIISLIFSGISNSNVDNQNQGKNSALFMGSNQFFMDFFKIFEKFGF